mgnify:CR=1 FL=1
MNMISMVLVALVAFTYFGGKNVPKVLKDNKQMVLGFSVGVLLQQFMDVGIEGLVVIDANGLQHRQNLAMDQQAADCSGIFGGFFTTGCP